MEIKNGHVHSEKLWNAFGEAEEAQNKPDELLEEKGKRLLSQMLDAEGVMRTEESRASFVNGWMLASWIMLDTFVKPHGTTVEELHKNYSKKS